jgi:hypothetical protein
MVSLADRVRAKIFTLGYVRKAVLQTENASKSRFLSPAVRWRLTSARHRLVRYWCAYVSG